MIGLIFHRTLPHYRVEILKYLNERFGLIWVHSGSPFAGVTEGRDRQNAIHVRAIDIKFARFLGVSSDVMVLMDVISPIHRFRPRVVVAQFELSMLSIWLLFLLRKIYGFKLILWGHGFDRMRGFHPDTSLMDKIRLRWIQWSDAVILYNENRRVEIARYVEGSSKLFVANNTLETNSLLSVRQKYDQIGPDELKRELGFRSRYNLVYVGRLVEDKQPDYLVDVFHIIVQQLPDTHLHIVGQGPLKDKLTNKADELGLTPHVTFWGEVIDPRLLGKIIYCSDAMVLPGFVGLAIVHAFCFGRPMITQAQGRNGPYHSTEIEYLVHGKTGFLAPPGDKGAMSEIIIQFLTDAQRKVEMERHILDVVEHQCSVERMMLGFQQALAYVDQRTSQ